jgi:hypothetical protein
MQDSRFPRDYLEYKLSKGDILAVAIVGLQKESWAVHGLKSYVSEKGTRGDFARAALVKIGTSKALRVLEGSLVPGAPSSVIDHALILLRPYGDKDSAELMKKLASDERFSESQRACFYHAYEAIERRIK